ncbi:MAG: hypothetical protein Q8N69_03100 [bacterium]|nr:hypothetical protein [bacterium]
MEKSIDFFTCGWYLTSGSYAEDYLKNPEKALKAFFKAGWHRSLFLKKYFRISDEEISVILESQKRINKEIFKSRLFDFCTSTPIARADFFRQVGQDFWNRTKGGSAARAFACILVADPNDPLSIFCVGFGYFCLNRWAEAIGYFQEYFRLEKSAGRQS